MRRHATNTCSQTQQQKLVFNILVFRGNSYWKSRIFAMHCEAHFIDHCLSMNGKYNIKLKTSTARTWLYPVHIEWMQQKFLQPTTFKGNSHYSIQMTLKYLTRQQCSNNSTSKQANVRIKQDTWWIWSSPSSWLIESSSLPPLISPRWPTIFT